MKVTRKELETRLQNAVYKASIKLCEQTEREPHGGNGHHKAQQICAKVLEEMEPYLEKWDDHQASKTVERPSLPDDHSQLSNSD